MQTKILFLDSTRATNQLNATEAEQPAAASGWVLGAGITSVAGSGTSGPFGYGEAQMLTVGASVPGRTLKFLTGSTMPAGGVTVSMFIRRVTLGTVRLAVEDRTNFSIPAVDATWDAVEGRFKTGSLTLGGLGACHQFSYDKGWQRISLTVIPGTTTGVTAGNNWNIVIIPQGLSAQVEIWGVMIEDNVSSLHNGAAGVTDFTATFGLEDDDDFRALVASAPVSAVRVSGGTRTALKARFQTAPAAGTGNVRLIKVPAAATPYITGINPSGFDHQSLPELTLNEGPLDAGENLVVHSTIVADTLEIKVQERDSPSNVWVTRLTQNQATSGIDPGLRTDVSGPTARHIRAIISSSDLDQNGIISVTVSG